MGAGRVVRSSAPGGGRQGGMRGVREVLAAEDDATGGTDLAGALRCLNGVQQRRAVVFLVSDFLSSARRPDEAADYEKLLRVVARRHDVVCIPVSDPAEAQLPDVGLAELEDPESG